MRKITCLLLFIFSFISFSEEYTVEKLLKLVKEGSDDLVLADLEYAAGHEEVKIYQAAAMPQISFNNGMSFMALSIDRMMASNPGSSTGIQSIPYSHIDGTAFNWSINVFQPLVTFGRIPSAIRASKIRRNSLEDLKHLRVDVYHLSVISGFAQVYFAQASIELAERSLDYYKKLLSRITLDIASGNGIRRDSLEIQAMVFKAESDLIMAKSKRKIALNRLEKLTEKKFDEKNTIFRYNKSGWASTVSGKEESKISSELKLKKHEIDLLGCRIKSEKSTLFPSIDIIGGIDNELLLPRNDYIKSLIGNPGLESLFENNYFNYSIGLQLNWNIFDGRRSLSNYRKAKIDAQKADMELKKLTEENGEAINEATDALIVLDEAQKAVELQIEAVNVAFNMINTDYKDGFTDLTTMLNLERKKREAENYLNEIYMQRLLAVAQLKLASGEPLMKETK